MRSHFTLKLNVDRALATIGDDMSIPNGLMIGTGEYTTGYVHGAASQSDKSFTSGLAISTCSFRLTASMAI